MIFLLPLVALMLDLMPSPTGEFAPKVTSVTKEHAGVFAKADADGEPTVTTETDTIVADRGLAFGMVFTVNGPPSDGLVMLVGKVTHPEIVQADGTRVTSEESMIIHRADSQWPGHLGYRFDNDGEMAEGDWTFSLYDGRKLLNSTTFHVRKPAPVEASPSPVP